MGHGVILLIGMFVIVVVVLGLLWNVCAILDRIAKCLGRIAEALEKDSGPPKT